MIRSSLCRLLTRRIPLSTVSATTSTCTSTSTSTSATGSRSAPISSTCAFSTNLKQQRDDELCKTDYSDAFDESDALEIGKEELTHLQDQKATFDATAAAGDDDDDTSALSLQNKTPHKRTEQPASPSANAAVTNNIRKDEEVIQKNFSDESDESDLAETEKKVGHEETK